MIVDLFAGGGGASMGIERAFGRAVDVAINHDAEAVAMHRANHPHTHHYCQNVKRASPEKVTGGRPVGLLWLSPDCTHFSSARGYKPVKKKIRGLANVAIRWAKAVKPRVIMLENVREFCGWGPCLPVKGPDGATLRWPDGSAKMVPDPRRKGRTFEAWKRKLEAEGYAIEHRVLNAADYGAATHRRRFFLIARCDGRPIAWPEPTHGPGRPLPYRTAAEFIDWSLPLPSIFLTKEEGKALGVKRPLAPKTMNRIAMGLRRFVLDHPRPFLVHCNHGGEDFRGRGVREPLSTVTGRHGFGVVGPSLFPLDEESADASVRVPGGRHHGPAPELRGHQRGAAGTGPEPARPGGMDPDRGGVGHVPDPGPAAPFCTAQFGERDGQEPRAHRVDGPIPTITPRGGGGFPLIAGHLTRFFGGERQPVGKELDEPLPTVTAVDHHGVVAASLSQYNGKSIGQEADKPAPTALAQNRHTAIMAASLVQYNSEKGPNEVRGCHPDEPVKTITGDPRFALAGAYVTRQNHGEKPCDGVDEPCRTITAQGNHLTLTAAFLGKHNGDRPDGSSHTGQPADGPLPTTTARATQTMLTSANLVRLGQHGGNGHYVNGADAPLTTVTSKAEHCLVGAKLDTGGPAVADRGADVRAFLMKYNGTAVGLEPAEPIHTITPVDRFGLVTVRGQLYEIADIGLRMLTPRELFGCQGFPPEYILDPFVKGRKLPKDAQTRMVGNSVPPQLPEALVRANFPEECVQPVPPAKAGRRRPLMEVAS